MAFVSLYFIIFFLVLLTAYYLFPRKYQWLLLLSGSLIFYVFSSPYYLVFLLFSAGTTYCCGVLMGDMEAALQKELLMQKEVLTKEEKKARKAAAQRNKKRVLAACIVANLLILVLLKYTNFFMENINYLLHACGLTVNIPQINWLLPLGISFYTFITIGYCMDVYRGISEPQQNFFKHVLFVSYFPQITQGPINRYGEMAEQLFAEHVFDWQRCKEGGYRILVGLFKKLVIAERLAVYVDRVYAAPDSYGSMTLLFATVFYAIQLYCDFSGYMDIVLGVSEFFGIQMLENFNHPYFSKTISEYWRRWHITLGAWFKDYLYYPVLRSDFCRRFYKKHGNKMSATILGLSAVWLMTGLWHGASWHYVAHGIYHGVIIILSVVLAAFYKNLREGLHIREESKVFHVFQMLRTFILVDVSYIMFRSATMTDALYIMKQIFFHLNISVSALKDAVLPFTEDNTAVAYFGVVAAAVLVLLTAEILDYNGKQTLKKHRYLNSAVMIVAILLFGVFGQSGFLYAQY